MSSLRETNPEYADELFNQYVSDFVDLILYTSINEYNIGFRYVKEYYETETRYDTMTVYEEETIDGKV